MVKKSMTLKEYFKKNKIRYQHIKSVSYGTIANIMNGKIFAAKWNDRYKGRFSYYPSDNTIINLSKELDLSLEETKNLIDNQLKSLKD